MEFVRLKCIKVGSKLRIRIISPGYFNEANCQFPRNLRVENRIYEVPTDSISLISRSKNYYNIKKDSIKIIENLTTDLIKIKVFEDTSSDDCAICMTNEKCMVIVPCGHYYTCEECISKIKKSSGCCPICRIKFTKTINKSEID
jgi:hypothetical protein